MFIFFVIQSREVWHRHLSFLTAVPTRTLAVVVRGVYAADSMISLFSCCASGPINTLKLVVRWRRRRVFWGGIFRSMASVSPLKRGSRIWEKGRMFIFYTNICKSKLLECLAEDFSLSTCSHSSLMILNLNGKYLKGSKKKCWAWSGKYVFIIKPYACVE